MEYSNDAMIEEIHQIRLELWEESGHNLSTMAETIKKEARTIMLQYGKALLNSIKSTDLTPADIEINSQVDVKIKSN